MHEKEREKDEVVKQQRAPVLLLIKSDMQIGQDHPVSNGRTSLIARPVIPGVTDLYKNGHRRKPRSGSTQPRKDCEMQKSEHGAESKKISGLIQTS